MPAARRRLTALALLGAALFVAAPSPADPPPWAPAHGYRHKHHKEKVIVREVPPGHRDVGIGRGTCKRGVVGTILGGIVGGAVGSRIGKGDGRTAATIAGAIVGAIIGREIGRAMDEADRYCTGQVLEQAPDGRTVKWRNPDTGAVYEVTPKRTVRGETGPCREFVTRTTIGGRTQETWGTACRQPDGSWRMVQR